MSTFEEVENGSISAGWTSDVLPEECVGSFDPKQTLALAVRTEVVTRLKAEHARNLGDDMLTTQFEPGDRETFLGAMLSEDRHAFDRAVEAMDLRRKPFDDILRNLITPSLDDLGMLWRRDEADFLEVTLATCRVQTLVCQILGATARRNRPAERHGRIAFARPDGESHTLGLTVVTECFRIDGWTVMGGVDLEVGDALWSLVSEEHIDVLGLTVGSVGNIPAVADAIAQAKKVSLNRNIVIGIGGYCAISDPDAIGELDADFVSVDALDAIDTAASFLDPRPQEA